MGTRSSRFARRIVTPLLAALALTLAFGAPHAADIVPSKPAHPTALPDAPHVQNPQLVAIDQQIKALSGEYHGQLDPLQAQVKALHEKYDPQLKALQDQRWTIAEQGKPQAIQQLDAQEKSDLAALADREKSDVDAVRQRYANDRKDLQQRYAEKRKAAQAAR